MRFKEWLLQENASTPGSKQALYPMGYGGIGLYPPSDVITWGADAITYMPEKIRQLTFIWGKGMLENPCGEDSLYERIKGKTAKQIQAGNLKANDEDGLFPNFSNVIPQRTIQVGGLRIDDDGFKKTDFVKKIPQKQNSGFWDYKQIGNRPHQPLPQTPITKELPPA